MMNRVWAVVLAVFLCLATVPAAAAPPPVQLASDSAMDIRGIAADPDKGVYWAYDAARTGANLVAFAVTGEQKGVVTFAAEVTAAAGVAVSGKNLYLLDALDSESARASGTLFRVRPAGTDGKVKYRSWDFVFPDGPNDAQAVLAGADGQIYIFTQGASPAVYELAAERSSSSINRLTRIGDLPAGFSSVVAQGEQLAARAENTIYELDPKTFEVRGSYELNADVPAGLLCGSVAGADLVTVSSTGVVQPAVAPAATATPSPSDSNTASTPPDAESTEEPTLADAGGPSRFGTTVAVGAAALLALLAGVAMLIRKSR